MTHPATTAALAPAMQRLSSELQGVVAALSAGVSPADAAEIIAEIEAAGRLMDAARVFAAAPLAAAPLAAAPLAGDPLAAERMGFASPIAAVASLARVSERAARERLRLAEATRPDLSVSGAPLPPRHEHVASALAAGELGVEAALVVVRELDNIAPRVEEPARRAGEAMMVNLACGLDPMGERVLGPVSVDYVTREIRLLGSAIDPDGALPREERAARGRAVRVGKEDADGLMPLSGRVVPELGVLLLRLLEAWRRSPRFADADAEDPESDSVDDFPPDPRTPDQRRHDALAEVLMAAAGADDAPRLNGRLVSVLVTVTADDLFREGSLDSDSIGTMSGSDFPVSRAQVDRFIDAAGYREVVLTPQGAIHGMRSSDRCFSGPQASAIAARDGERCFTPGCTSPHTALQVHHVVPWREGGKTVTSNGILLCYWHHRRVDDGPWQYRMVEGVPEARGPGVPEWRRAAASPIRSAAA